MKTIKIYVEGGVVQHVAVPTEYSKLLHVEVIDYDMISKKERQDYESERS